MYPVFRKTHSILLPCLIRTKEKMQAVLFLSHLSAIAEQIHVIVIAFVYSGVQTNFLFSTDSREIIYPVCD